MGGEQEAGGLWLGWMGHRDTQEQSGGVDRDHVRPWWPCQGSWSVATWWLAGALDGEVEVDSS